jgi:hypothetical protein
MRPLKVLFVQLGFDARYPDVSTRATTYNDGLYYVASFLLREWPGLQADVCQMFWGEHPRDFPLAEYDYILISALATHFWSNLDVLEFIRDQRRPGCRVILGGPHATFAPHEALRYADFAVLGEGEVPALQLLHVLEEGGDLNSVDNLAFPLPDGGIALTSRHNYGGLDTAIEPTLLVRAPRLHWATVSMSRGCPFDCSFCYAIRILGRRFRPKQVETIVSELGLLARQTGCTRFYVTDLNFTTRAEFCDRVAEAVQGRGYQFVAMSRIELADDLGLLRRLRAAGFTEYCLGVESEDPGVLAAFNKRVDPSAQTDRLLRFAAEDVYTHSAVIFGLDTQDLGAIRRTAAWCAEARLMHPTFVCLAEYPFQGLLFGTRQDVEDHRIIMETPTYQHYSFVGIFPRHMRPSVLQRAILDSYDVFFARALETESRPKRRARLNAYARSVADSIPGMERHIAHLEQLEQPYYTPSGSLKEDLLKSDFDGRYGPLREYLRCRVRRPGGLPLVAT